MKCGDMDLDGIVEGARREVLTNWLSEPKGIRITAGIRVAEMLLQLDQRLNDQAHLAQGLRDRINSLDRVVGRLEKMVNQQAPGSITMTTEQLMRLIEALQS